MSILDEYVNAAPSRQTAVDMFAGEWSSKFPEGCGAIRYGDIILEDDALMLPEFQRHLESFFQNPEQNKLGYTHFFNVKTIRKSFGFL